MKAKLADTMALSREIVREHYQGSNTLWLSLQCEKSVWIGTGERVLVGGAIREHFRSRARWKERKIFREEYYTLAVNARSAAVTVQVLSGSFSREEPDVMASHTLLYQMVGSETKVVLTHSSRGFLRSHQSEKDGPVMWVPAYHLYRNLLADTAEVSRLSIPSSGRNFYIHPNVILYVRSRERRAELNCVDAVLRSDLSIRQLNALLPEEFCPIHRCYTVNSRYVSAIQRYKVTLVTGETLPVPAEAYQRVKAELDRRIGVISKG